MMNLPHTAPQALTPPHLDRLHQTAPGEGSKESTGKPAPGWRCVVLALLLVLGLPRQIPDLRRWPTAAAVARLGTVARWPLTS
jgi:hypothetical protein